MTGRDPALSSLLSRALVGFARDFERTAPNQPAPPSIVLWSNLLRLWEGDEAIPRRDIPRLVRLSTRSVKATIDLHVRSGWLAVGDDPQRARSTVIRLEEPARRARDAWRPLAGMVEQRWRERVGDEPVDRLRRHLERLVGQIDLELPHYPTGYGVADRSMTGGAYTLEHRLPDDAGSEWMPRVGQDWHPVPREGGRDRVSGLPLSALLSQAVVAFAMEYERHRRGPMALVANVLRRFGDDPVPIASIPGAGVTGDGRSVLERHLLVTADRPVMQLTPHGRDLRDAYEPIVTGIETNWSSRYGTDLVGDLRRALAEVDRSLDPDLPDFPDVHFRWDRGFTEAAAATG